MSRRLASLIGAFALSAVSATAGVAVAEVVPAASAAGGGYTAMDAPLGAPVELRVDIVGEIASRCDLTSGALVLDPVDLTRAGEIQAGFRLDCNTPFTLRVRSQGGGFVNDAPAPGVRSSADYQLAVDVTTDAGRRNLGWCDAAELADGGAGSCAFAPQGGGWSSGEDTAIDKAGAVRLRWTDENRSAPLFGDYRDTITIELKARA